MTNKQLVLDCDCYSANHQIIIKATDWTGLNEGDNLTFYVQMQHYQSWWRRVLVAIRYILGKEEPYGHWDTTLLDPKKVTQLKEFLTSL